MCEIQMESRGLLYDTIWCRWRGYVPEYYYVLFVGWKLQNPTKRLNFFLCKHFFSVTCCYVSTRTRFLISKFTMNLPIGFFSMSWSLAMIALWLLNLLLSRSGTCCWFGVGWKLSCKSGSLDYLIVTSTNHDPSSPLFMTNFWEEFLKCGHLLCT